MQIVLRLDGAGGGVCGSLGAQAPAAPGVSSPWPPTSRRWRPTPASAPPIRLSIGPGGAEKTDDVMKQKLENYASSFIEAIAEKRGRNVEWAESRPSGERLHHGREGAGAEGHRSASPTICPTCCRRIRWPRGQRQGVWRPRGREVVEIPMIAARAGVPAAVAARGDADPDAGRHLRHHRRTEQSRGDPAGRGGRDRADPGAVHGGGAAGQRRRAGADRPGAASCSSSISLRRRTAC